MIEMAASKGWLQPLRDDWPSSALRMLESGSTGAALVASTVVRVVVVSMRGSAPREAGACMLVSLDGIEGSIGGGHLEEQAIQSARAMLHASDLAPAVHIRQLVLGRDLAQCCGGAVQLWLERFTHADMPLLQAAAYAARTSDSALLESDFDGHRVTRWLIDANAPESGRLLHSIASQLQDSRTAERGNFRALLDTGARVLFTQTSSRGGTLLERLSVPRQALYLFGAGHVGQAIARALYELPYRVTWVDSRAEFLPAELPEHLSAKHLGNPLDALRDAPQGALYLVLTHDHGIDYDLCQAILQRNDFAWLGLIGSESKAARFRSRLRRDGFTPEQIGRLVCPIGLEGIESKAPAAIAISVAAQLLQVSTGSSVRAASGGSAERSTPSNGSGMRGVLRIAVSNDSRADADAGASAGAGVGASADVGARAGASADGCGAAGESCDRCSTNPKDLT